MNANYVSRIMIALPDQEPVELVRFKRAISSYDRRHWLRDLSDAWIVVEERVCRINPGPRPFHASK